MNDEKIMDTTGVALTPGKPNECLGNGEHADEKGDLIECCCDECDYLITCLQNEKKAPESRNLLS